MRIMAGVLIMLLIACSIEERGAPGTDPEVKLDLTKADDSLEVTLRAASPARSGDDVPITITVRNTTGRTLELALMGRAIAFDMAVSRNDSIVWQRQRGETIPAILQLKQLLAREAFELSDVWHANVPPGRYAVTAKIFTDAQPLEPDPITITIE